MSVPHHTILHPVLLPFGQITSDNANCVGGKAWNLARLTQSGFPVPPGSVLTTEVFQRFLELHKEEFGPWLETIYQDDYISSAQELIAQIRQSSVPEDLLRPAVSYWQDLQQQGFSAVAVRSSCNFEDMEDASFAGQYETVLNVGSPEKLQEAILHCWASVYDPRVLSYCQSKGIDHRKIRVGLIIQAMVPSEAAGVIFTVHPMTGNAYEIVLQAVSGLGEALVQGTVTPDTYHYNWNSEAIEIVQVGKQEKGLYPKESGEGIAWRPLDSDEPILSENQISVLGKLALDVQMHYGAPQDIEWAWFKGQPYLLQARPITRIEFKTKEDWTNADFKDGGIASSIASPFMWSLYREVFSTSMPEFLRNSHIYPNYEPDSWAEWFLGYPYWNLSAVKDGATKIPGFNERKFDEDLGIVPNYAGDGRKTRFTPRTILRGLRILAATNRSIRARELKCLELRKYVTGVVAEFEALDLGQLSQKALQKVAEKLIVRDYLHVETTYFKTIYDSSNATTFFHEALEKYNRKAPEPLNSLRLIGGLRDLSHMRTQYDLWDLRTEILSNAEARLFYREQPVKEICHQLQIGQSVPMEQELRAYLEKYRYHSRRELDMLVPHWDEDPAQVIESLKSLLEQSDDQNPRQRNQQQFQYFQTEWNKIRSKKIRQKLATHRNLLWWREETRDLSTRMYHCLRRLGLEWGRRFVAAGHFEAPEDAFFLDFRSALDFWAGNQPTQYLKQTRKNKLYHQSFRNWQPPNEIWSRKQPLQANENSKGLSGIPCSAGRVSGLVNVIASIDQVDQLEDGAILVTRFTDPAWTPVFARISGLVTETGGLLSHGAVVSREYGIPAILALPGATQKLRTGMYIELDGDTGHINIITAP